MQVTRILDSIVLFHGYPVALRPDQTRPDQTRPDQTRPDQTRPDQTLHQRLPGGH